MTDDALRDRVAAALAATHKSGETTFTALADAALAEIDLATPCNADGCRMRKLTRKHA